MARWNRIQDKLPKHKQLVLVYQDGSNICDDFRIIILWYDKKNKAFRGFIDGNYRRNDNSEYCTVTHWRKLMKKPN